MKNTDYIEGSWHMIAFHTDLAEREVEIFASKMQKAYENSGMPANCEARRHTDENGVQRIFLSPPASSIARQQAEYSHLLESCSSPSDFSQLKKMRIFQ